MDEQYRLYEAIRAQLRGLFPDVTTSVDFAMMATPGETDDYFSTYATVHIADGEWSACRQINESGRDGAVKVLRRLRDRIDAGELSTPVPSPADVVTTEAR